MGRTTEILVIKNYGDLLKANEGNISEDDIRKVEVEGIVDTGATFVSIGKKDMETLGLPYKREVNIKTANLLIIFEACVLPQHSPQRKRTFC